MTSKGRASLRDASTRSVHSRRPHPDIKKTGERSISTYHAKTDCAAPPNGSNAWTGGKSLATLRTTPQGTSPSSPTYTPQKCTTTMTTKIPLGHYPHGSLPPLVGAEPHSPHSIASLTNSLFITGASWQKSIDTRRWTSSVSRCVARSTSSNRTSKRPTLNRGSANESWTCPKLTAKSPTCDWDKRGPE